jgi:hypothetical protein
MTDLSSEFIGRRMRRLNIKISQDYLEQHLWRGQHTSEDSGNELNEYFTKQKEFTIPQAHGTDFSRQSGRHAGDTVCSTRSSAQLMPNRPDSGGGCECKRDEQNINYYSMPQGNRFKWQTHRLGGLKRRDGCRS